MAEHPDRPEVFDDDWTPGAPSRRSPGAGPGREEGPEPQDGPSRDDPSDPPAPDERPGSGPGRRERHDNGADGTDGDTGAAADGGRSDDGGRPDRGRRPDGGPGSGPVANRQVQLISDPDVARRFIAELLERQARGRGKVVGVAGLPRHGKSELATRLRLKAAARKGMQPFYNKTVAGDVNLYDIPTQRQHHALIDMAGEDFQALGDYAEPALPRLMRDFLWPVLQRLDGLILMMALPIVWQHYNDPYRPGPVEVGPEEERATRDAVDRMVNAHVMLLKYAAVAGDLERLRRRFPGLDAAEAPSRDLVDTAFKGARPLKAPVALAFSKADLYESHNGRPALHTPPLPGGMASPPLHPLRSDPLFVAWLHFRDLFDFLTAHVRHFKFDFVQVLDDRSDDPLEALEADRDLASLVGAESLLDFVTAHPWGFSLALSTGRALRWDRRLRPGRWREGAFHAVDGRPGR